MLGGVDIYDTQSLMLTPLWHLISDLQNVSKRSSTCLQKLTWISEFVFWLLIAKTFVHSVYQYDAKFTLQLSI